MTAALIVAILLQLLDVHSTLLFMRRGVGEANPLIRWAMARFGKCWIVLKLAIGGAGVWLLWQSGHPAPLWLLCAGYAFLVVRNYRIARG